MAISKNPDDLPSQPPDVQEIWTAMNLVPGDDARCLYCLEPVSHPAIYWHGLEHVWLHPTCAVRLAGSLLSDWKKVS